MKNPTRSAQPTTASRRRKTLAFAIMAVLCAGGAMAADHAATGSLVAVARPTRMQAGDAVTGALPLNQPIHIEVALKLRNKNVLDAFIAKSQSARTAPQLMTPAQFLASHAPTQAQAQQVADYLTAKGYSNVTIASNRLLVSADGTAATARAAFMTSFAQVRTTDGRIAYANTDDARIPASLSDTVLAVVGLQDVHQYHTFAQRLAPGSVHTEVMQTHAPLEFTQIYGGNNVDQAGSTIGIVSDGNLTSTIANLAAYVTASGDQGEFVTHQVVKVNGSGSDTSHTDEWSLDSQVVAAMLGDEVPVTLIFYDVPTLSAANVTADLNAIVAANKARIVVASVGECETDAQTDGSAAADDTILETAIAQGQTFSVPAGDAGADECADGSNAPLWPASSQYAIAVGGTNLNGPVNQWTFEQVWPSTGGSPSKFEPMPAWQTAFGVPGTTRGVPDIAYDANPASGSLTYVGSGTTPIGGTGLSASIFAGMWGRELATYDMGAGFAGPVLYGLPAADFHDIVSGNNHGETAGTGYDFASGRGSVIILKAVSDSQTLVNKPPVASFTLTTTGSRSLTVTDTSTDSDGTIVVHHWAFGDGTTATTANASHTYAADGTYTVTDKVTDNDGAATSLAKKFVASTTNTQLIGNPSFETGSFSPWYHAQSGGQAVTLDTNPADAFDGSDSASINYQANSKLYQKVTLPTTGTTATLTYHLWVSNGNLPAGLTQTLYVELASTADGTATATLATFTNADASSGYATYTYDMTPYMGQTVYLRFRNAGTTQSTGTTGHFSVDDVTLTEQ